MEEFSDKKCNYICLLHLLRYTLGIILCALLSSLPCRAQHVNFFEYDTEDGLPSSEVYCAFQSRNGVLWFASDRGIFTYNGYSFKTYTTNDGLGNNTIFSIFEDNNGSLWFTGYNGTLTQYQNGKFQVHQTISDFVRKNYPSDWVAFCEFDSENIYFTLSRKRIILSFNRKTLAITHMTEFDNIPVRKVFNLGNSKYISNFRLSDDVRYQQGYYRVSKLIPLNDSQFICGAKNKVYFLQKKREKWLWTDSLVFEADIQHKNACIVNEQERTFCVSSDDGLYLCNFGGNAEVRKLVTNENMTSIIRDKEGNYWATSLNKGVIKIPSLFIRNVANERLHGRKINSVMHFDRTLVAGSNIGELTFINEKGITQHFKETGLTVAIEQISLFNDRLIFANFLYQRSLTGAPVWHQASGILGYYAASLDRDHFFVASNSVIQIYSKLTTRPTALLSQNFEHIKAIAYTNNTLWVGTIGNLSSMTISDHKLLTFIDHSKKNPLLANRINDIKAFRHGVLVAIFGKGLGYFDGNTLILLHSKLMGKNDLINKIFVLDNSNILLCTNNGLLKYTLEDGKIALKHEALFNSDDGLSSNFVNNAWVDKGELWLATNKGVNHLPLNTLTRSHIAPFLNIHGIRTTDSFFHNQNRIILEYFQNSFGVEFEGISFRKPNRFSFYKYALVKKGSDTTWYYTNEGNVQFTNLAHGEYTFLVAARNKNNDWSPNKSMLLVIRPHFTQTIYFAISIALALALIIFLWIRNRLQKIKHDAEQKQAIELLKHKAQVTELTALRNQMNPHFIFNSLNSIQRFLISDHFEEANIYISKFARLMRDSLSMSKLEYMPLNREIEFINNYLDLEQRRFDNLFEYEIVVDKEIDGEMTRVPSLLIQPLLENAVKHGFKDITAGGKIILQIRDFDPDHVEIVVENNGKPIENIELVMSDKGKDNSFGVGIVMQRIKLIKEKTGDEKIQFHLENIENGVTARIIIPKQS